MTRIFAASLPALRRVRLPGLFVLKLTLAAVTVGLVVHVVAWGEIAAAARSAEAGWIALALALLPANVGLEAYRWHRLVEGIAPGVRFSESLAAVLCGYPLGLATPGRVGDYAGRALYLRHGDGWALTALTAVERLATLAITLAVGLAVLGPFLLVQTGLRPGLVAALLGGGGLVAAALVALLLHPRAAQRPLGRLLPARVASRLGVVHEIPGREMRLLLALSAVRYGIYVLQFVCLVFAFAPGTEWGTAASGVALVFFVKSVVPSFTLADIGIREGAAVFVLGALGVEGAAAFNAAFLLFGVNLVLPALAGLPFVAGLRLGDGEAAA